MTCFLRTSADTVDMGKEFFLEYREKRAELGITAHALTPPSENARKHFLDGDDEATL